MQLFNVYPLFDIEPVKGQGSFIYDKNGQQYLDFYGGHAVISIGHSHPHFVKKLKTQAEQLIFYSNSVQNSLQKQVAKKLGQLSGLDDFNLFLCNSGAEANENALKLASFKTGKTKVIAFENAFHGRTSAAVNVTHNPKIQAPINQVFEKEFHEFNQVETVAKSLEQGDTCAVILECIQGIGGIHVAEGAFLQDLRALCTKYQVPLICDEVQSGFGRSGKFFAFQHEEITPDLVTVAKGMGNGFPVGGVLIHPDFPASYGLLGTTFGGNHLACAAVLAVLEIIEEEELLKHATKNGQWLKAELAKLESVKEVRGQGLMIGVEFEFPIAKLRKQLLYQFKTFTGSSSNKNVLRLLPPLTVNQSEIELFLFKIKKALSSWKVLQKL